MRSATLIVTLLSLAALAYPQPASDLLQSGIYSQETLGDLNAAIRAYQQILDAGASMRLYAPQAQYRLGVCLARKRDTSGATRAFTSLLRDYPGQRDLVSLAREALARAGGLLPAPWGETELAEYRWTIPGTEAAWSLSRIGPASKGSHTLRIRMNVYTPEPNVSMVDLDSATMLPLLDTYRSNYRANLPQIVSTITLRLGPSASAPPAPLPAESAPSPVYAQTELVYLLRRLPLFPGWSSTLSVLSPIKQPATLRAQVVATEDVVVPAGTFHCYKVRLLPQSPAAFYSTLGAAWLVGEAGETLWYGSGEARPLVKMESGGAIGELASRRTAENVGTSSYHDPQAGYSFTVPAGWVFHARNSFHGAGTSVDLVDPESQAAVMISGKTQTTDPGRIELELNAGLAQFKLNRPRFDPGTASLWRLAGNQALTWIAQNPTTGSTEYITYVQSPSTRASIGVTVKTTEFERFRQRFQPILDSFRMP